MRDCLLMISFSSLSDAERDEDILNNNKGLNKITIGQNYLLIIYLNFLSNGKENHRGSNHQKEKRRN